MAVADFTCEECGCTRPLEQGYDDTLWCRGSCGHLDCSGYLTRVWSPVAIGRVPGAGGSPPRPA